MAYNSSHTGPEIDAAVEMLGQIQEARESTKTDRVEVKKLAGEVKVNAEQVATQATTVNGQAAQVSSDALAVATGRDEAVAAALAAEDSKDAAALSQSAAEQSQAAASASEKAAAESQLAAGLSEQVSAGHAAEATAAAQQVAADKDAADESARSAARSAQNAEAVVTGGTASTIPGPGKIPLADAQGVIAEGWIPEEIARTAAVEAAVETADEALNASAESRASLARFLLPSPEAPAVRDDGSPLQIGDRYTNTVDQAEYRYTDSGWQVNESLQAIADIQNASDPEKGASEVGFEGGTVADALYSARTFTSYEALRASSGRASLVRIGKAGAQGYFAKLNPGQNYIDDGGVTIVCSNGTAYGRLIDGDIKVLWFEPPTGGADALPAFNRAAAAAIAMQNGSSSASTPRIIVEGGTYTLSDKTTGSVHWVLTPTGKLTTPSNIPGLDFSCERLSGKFTRHTGANQYTGNISGDPSLSANKILTDIGAPNLFPAEYMGCSAKAAGGVFGSSRTGSRDGYDMASIGVIGLSVNDNIATPKPGYAGYFEGVRLRGTGNENGLESTIVNMGEVYKDTPRKTRSATSGESYNTVLTSGGASGSGAQDATGAICISGKAEGAYDLGIMFKFGSLKSNIAMSLWENHRFSWYGVGDQNVEREGVRVTGFVAANEQGVLNLNTWDNASSSYQGVTIQSSALSPITDNKMSIGTAQLRPSVVFSATGTIQTSDERVKSNISEIPDIVLDAWALVKYKSYQFSDAIEAKGGDARWHFGVTAQSVKEAFESLGLNPLEYGVLCYDSWDDQWEEIPASTRSVPAVYSDIVDGKGQKILVSEARVEVIEPARRRLKVAAGDRYGVRYDEAAILSLALMKRTIERSAS